MKKSTNNAGNQKGKKRSAKKGLLIGLCVFLGLILVIGIAGIIYTESLLGLIGQTGNQGELSQSEIDAFLEGEKDTMPEDFDGDIVDPDALDWGSAPMIESSEDVINILLIGQDRRANEGNRARSDSMILCTLNKKTNTLTMTSFMRDMYVKIPGYQANRINASYFLGGSKLLNETLAYNFGVKIDGNIEVDFFGCMKCIDEIGGVEIELNQSEANYLNRHGNWDITNEGYWNLKAGKNLLTGSQAVAYSRIRYVGNGDFERTERQRKVLTAIFNKCKSLSLVEMNNLLNKFLPNLSTDLSRQELLGYATTILTTANKLTIQTQRIPADGTYSNSWISGMAVLLPDLEKNRALLEGTLKAK